MGDWIEDPAEPSGWRYDKDAPTPAATPVDEELLDKIDGFCEDRSEAELTDDDGTE